MSEVGLVRFGQVALEVAQATVPRYRTTFSKHQFYKRGCQETFFSLHRKRGSLPRYPALLVLRVCLARGAALAAIFVVSRLVATTPRDS